MSFVSFTKTLAPCPHNSENVDDICSETMDDCAAESAASHETSLLVGPNSYLNGDARIERAWAHWKKLGEPKLIVAPMVDNSELPFRLLCRKYGADAAYTPMLHSRIFTENEKYRSQEFTTCKEDRPLFVQFCANDPDTLLEAARRVEPYCDYVDINLGCPQRIAKRGNYGAFLMDKLPLVKSLVEKLAQNLNVPVTVDWVYDGEDGIEDGKLDQADLVIEYLKLCEKYPVPWRMIRAHLHKMLGEWFRIHPHVRDDFNAQFILTFEFLYDMVNRLRELGVSRPLYVKNT
ncbi:hypothetical protein E3N88_20268 [Mikania micrantha]|uniref:tRNA-dihydrouridine(16/17) synthase [NAD(P)(+)] n=1 Tax=Mikania micrantha TaxID=192012 RepID=A0A5N6NJ51_9ASTR|nr:hypothetical protein E3N88_20268 [Mikania micrantha]